MMQRDVFENEFYSKNIFSKFLSYAYKYSAFNGKTLSKKNI